MHTAYKPKQYNRKKKTEEATPEEEKAEECSTHCAKKK